LEVALRSIKILSPKLATGVVVLMVSACSSAGGGGGGGGALPAGETDLSCAALIYAAHSLVADDKVADAEGVINDKYFGPLTRYTTAHARAKGLEATGALGVVKVQAYRFMGTISSNDQVSSKKILERAKACIAS
jgi:hypothetical protein